MTKKDILRSNLTCNLILLIQHITQFFAPLLTQHLEGSQQNDFEQIIDDRYHKKSLILSSQLAVADWYGVFSNEMLAEACLDRIVHKSLRFDLKGDSMRKKY